MSNLSFIFFGTDEVALEALKELSLAGPLPKMVVTTPDQPQGRKKILSPTPVKEWAEQNGITVLTPDKLDDEFVARLRSDEYELGILVSYGKIVPQKLIDAFPKSILNIHPSLLPDLRGPSPIKSAILRGYPKTGVTIMQLVQKMDAGPILTQSEIDLSPQVATEVDLRKALIKKGVSLLLRVLPEWSSVELETTEQIDSKATFTEKFTGKDGQIDAKALFGDESATIAGDAIVRALGTEPGAWMMVPTTRGGKRVKIKKAHRDGKTFIPEIVVPEGKSEMTWENFLKGNPLKPSD